MTARRATRVLALVVAIAGFGIGAASLAVPSLAPIASLSAAVFIVASFWWMLTARNRPIADAWELGYDMGRRDQMREANGRGPNGGKPIFLRQGQSA